MLSFVAETSHLVPVFLVPLNVKWHLFKGAGLEVREIQTIDFFACSLPSLSLSAAVEWLIRVPAETRNSEGEYLVVASRFL